jgi:nitrite reductase/ring-hydroxylating ferredoxin subunit
VTPDGSSASAAGQTTERLRLMPAADVQPGTARRFTVPGRRALAVFNVGGEFFVTDDRCTHGMAPLSEGFLDGDVIECPWHGGAFNVRTGAPAAVPCTEPIRTYRATVEDGVVVIDYR